MMSTISSMVEEKVDFDRESETSVSVQWLERRHRVPLLMVFSNCNKTSPCSAFSFATATKRKRVTYQSASHDNDDETMSFLRREQLYRFFPVTLRDAFPLCLPEWKLDPLLVPPRSLLPSNVRARDAY